ncbi:AAA family ATPase [Nitratireductor sp. GZWM139]|uniref:AAA family ATPase n=1 Tax=Nitratireductor sp. GZWM139 TaxID=2950541 RepID=UPI0024BEDEC1|nr:AAA family ATPase [Nitratireductor sp. GZWM139]MDJ1465963.1 AAA family ATPase [Nitratireductor sp. GZWM139]
MIRLGPFPTPEIADDPYVGASRRELREYLRRPKQERAQRRAQIDEAFYFWEPVQSAVRERCFDKCVFCERSSQDIETVIETFRPLRDAGNGIGGSEQDHYVWLAYELENLVLVCIECSSRKRTEFPVIGERAPYLTPMSEIDGREKPLIVNPYRGNAERHFLFLADGRCEGVTKEGRFTSWLLSLNESRLLGARADEMDTLLGHLRASIENDGRGVAAYLDSRARFAGARIGVARRLFDSVEIGGMRIQGRSSSFVQQLVSALADADSTDQTRLLRRMDTLVEEDQARRSDQSDASADDMPVDLVSQTLREYRPEPRRTGGVEQIRISNFKGIHRLHIGLSRLRKRSKSTPCLMLLGENAVGKTSVLQAIALALIGTRHAKKLVRDQSDFLRAEVGGRWDQLSPTDAIVEADLRFGGEAQFHLDANAQRIDGPPNSACVVLGYGPRRYFDPRRTARPSSDHVRVRTLFDPTAALPYAGAWLDQLDDRQFNEVAKMMRIVLSLGDEDEVVRDLDDRICVSLGGETIPIERLSEGYRSVFALVADVARELLRDFRSLEDAEAVVLIDEIDTHLHPRWKMRVMSSLRLALPGVQFIVTTHDPLCLRGMDDGEVVVLQRDEEGRIVQLDDLPSIKGMRADQLLTSDYFGLSSTVDPETELGVARYVHRIGELPSDSVEEADRLVRQLALGDGALEQVVQTALLRFLRERERPKGALRPNVRLEAVQAVIDALESDRPVSGGKAGGS